MASVGAGGVVPDGTANVELTDGDLGSYRAEHPLARVMPLFRELMGTFASDGEHLLAVCDAQGRLLWVEGHPGTRKQAGRMNFVPGALWSEAAAGTNAPGTAVAVDHPVQVFAAEHFIRRVQPWTCAAAPVHDPRTGRVIGAVDITGGDGLAHPHSLAFVQAVARAAESHLALLAPPRTVTDGPLELTVLGRDEAQLVVDGRKTRLSRRHSEILVLLARHPEGLTGDELLCALYEDESVTPVTLRAELARLRRLLGPGLLESRPYRLTRPVESDVTVVERRLGTGAVTAAVAAYAGPLLPGSTAPAVVRLRRRLADGLRTALIARRDPDLLADWARSPWGRTTSTSGGHCRRYGRRRPYGRGWRSWSRSRPYPWAGHGSAGAAVCDRSRADGPAASPPAGPRAGARRALGAAQRRCNVGVSSLAARAAQRRAALLREADQHDPLRGARQRRRDRLLRGAVRPLHRRGVRSAGSRAVLREPEPAERAAVHRGRPRDGGGRGTRAGRGTRGSPAWGRTSVTARADILLKIADRMEANLEKLAVAESWENGKPVRETLAADIPLAIDHFRYFAGAARAQEGSVGEIDDDTVAYHFHEPLGVVAQIIPWNFPILMAVWKLAPALAAGNAVVIKPAEQTPASIHYWMSLISDLLPPGVVNIVNGFGVEAASRSRPALAWRRSRSRARPRRGG